jgi:hypothetical protein
MPKGIVLTITFLGICLVSFLIAFLFAIAVFPQPASPLNLKTLVASSNVTSSPIDSYKAQSSFPLVQSDFQTDDARPVIVDNFLAKHNSPMVGHGKDFVLTADKYGIDWRLLPAIAFQESNLGKKIPAGSHNAFGWAVFTGERSGAEFDSWPASIETVAKGIKERYINQGLTTPEAIMTKYTPSSDGSWAFGVRFAMDEMVQ